MPTYFSYLDLPECRKRTDTEFQPPGVGRIVNHWQWCGWQTHRTRSKEENNSTVIYTGALLYRITVMGWGSQSSNEVTIRIYADQISASAESALQPGNATLVVTPSCDFVYFPGTCSFSDPAPSKTFLDLKNGGMIEFTTSVGLPASAPDNLDRLTGFNLGVKLRVTSTVAMGDDPTIEDLQPVVRCDAATRGGFTKPACIFGGVVPRWSLNRNDSEIGEVAKHIWQAQNDPNSTIPPANPEGSNKIIPAGMFRATDEGVINANRNKAVYQCKKWFQPVPTDESCDEYPFASTYQGSLSLENEYSVKALNADQNSLEGSRRGSWYYWDRILENDYFVVSPY